MSSYEVLYWDMPMCQYQCQVEKNQGSYQQQWSCGQSQANYILDDAVWPGQEGGKCASLPPPPPPDIIAQHLDNEQVAVSLDTHSDLSSSYFLLEDDLEGLSSAADVR